MPQQDMPGLVGYPRGRRSVSLARIAALAYGPLSPPSRISAPPRAPRPTPRAPLIGQQPGVKDGERVLYRPPPAPPPRLAAHVAKDVIDRYPNSHGSHQRRRAGKARNLDP